MFLKRLRLRNINQHEVFDWKFRPGVTGILGPNGSGKSNLVNAIKATLTNDWSYKHRTKFEQIRRLSDEESRAFAQATWEHGDTTFSITRSLRPSRSILKVGNEKITHSGRIAARLQRLLPVSNRIIDEFVFVDQRATAGFFHARDTVRKASFAHLCGIEEIEKLWMLLGEMQRQDSSMVVENLESTDTLKARVRRLVERRDKLVQRRSTQRNRIMEESSVRSCRETIRLHEEHQLLQERARELDDRHTRLTRRHETVSTNLQKIFDEYDPLAAEHKADAEQRSMARKALRESVEMQRREDRKRLLKSRIESKPAPAPTWESKHGVYRDPAEVRAELTTLKNELDKVEHVLAELGGGNTVECPVCGTPTDKCVDHINKARQSVKTLPSEIKQLRDYVERCSRYKLELTSWERTESARKAEVQAAREEIKTIKVQKLMREDQAKELLRINEDRMERLRVLEKERDEHQRQINEVNGSLKTIRQESERVCDRLVRSDITGAAYTKARESIKRHEIAKVKSESLEEQLKIVEGELNDAKKELKRVRDLQRRTQVARGWLRDLEEWRAVVHRDNFPQVYMQRVLEDLVGRVNRRLHDFDGLFRVSVGPDVSFTVHNADGSCEDASGKSEGELVVLSICFRFAVNSRFAHDIGIMVLDEPTDGLDDHHMGCLASVLQRICEVTRRRGQQIIMITHDQRLERVFDHVIRLE